MASLQSILGGSFDSSAVEPQAPQGEPLPKGLYTVEITGSEIKQTKNGKGTGLKLEYTVLEGEYAKRKIFQFINLQHENQQAEQIGQSQLSALCRTLGIGVLADSDDLFQRILNVRVVVRAAANGYEASNDVKAFEPAGSAVPPPAARSSAPAPAATKAAPPWKK